MEASVADSDIGFADVLGVVGGGDPFVGLKETRIDVICCAVNGRDNKHERSRKNVSSSCSSTRIIAYLVLAMPLVRTRSEHHFLYHLRDEDSKVKSKRPGTRYDYAGKCDHDGFR